MVFFISATLVSILLLPNQRYLWDFSREFHMKFAHFSLKLNCLCLYIIYYIYHLNDCKIYNFLKLYNYFFLCFIIEGNISFHVFEDTVDSADISIKFYACYCFKLKKFMVVFIFMNGIINFHGHLVIIISGVNDHHGWFQWLHKQIWWHV